MFLSVAALVVYVMATGISQGVPENDRSGLGSVEIKPNGSTNVDPDVLSKVFGLIPVKTDAGVADRIAGGASGGSSSVAASVGSRPVSSFNINNYPPPRPLVRSPVLALGLEAAPFEDTTLGTTEADQNQGNIVSINKDWRPPNNTDNTVGERLQWQVSVFSKQFDPFLRRCGGSMISRAAVISAAHCFWSKDEGLLPASQFAVGAGEVLTYRRDDYDSYRQQNDVGGIKVPSSFRGSANNKDDIAVVLLAWPFYDTRGMRPACVSFDKTIEDQQLRAGNIATTLGVGIKKAKLTKLQTLRVPYIADEDCPRALDKDALQEWTEGKICAGFKPGMGPDLGDICSRDPGAGLAFFLGDDQAVAKGIAIPFLRGVASRSHPCDARIPTVYTRLSVHRGFLEEHLGDIVGECGKYYPQLGALVESKGMQFVCNCYC